MVSIDEFRRVAFAHPFTSFIVHLKDGRSFVVFNEFGTMLYPNTEHAISYAAPDVARMRSMEDEYAYRVSEIERIEIRPDLEQWDHRRQGWRRSG